MRHPNFERVKVEFLKEQICPGDVFIDVGACEGFYTMMAARIIGPSGLVIAVEPEGRNILDLRVNARELGPVNNILIESCALSNHVGSGLLYLGEGRGLHSLVKGLPHRSEDGMFVRVDTLDSLQAQLFTSFKIDGIKIDVEGAELEVLEGAEHTLTDNTISYLAMDVHPSLGVDVAAVRNKLIDYGFSIINIPAQGNEVFAVKN